MAPEPDKWLATGTVSAGGGHGPILFGESEVGGRGFTSLTHRATNSYVKQQGDFLPQPRFFTLRVQKISDFGKKEQLN